MLNCFCCFYYYYYN